MHLWKILQNMTRQQKMAAVGLCGVIIISGLIIIGIIGLISGANTASSPARPQETTVQSLSPTTQNTTVPETQPEDSVPSTTEDTVPNIPEATTPIQQDEDPQHPTSGNNSPVDISTIISGDGETTDHTLGVDVSKYQGTIDWAQVAEYGVDFAMIRVGYRTKVNGEIIADTNAKYNLQQAQKHGMQLGAYFFSTAITKEEAIEEANWVADYIAQYPITYPVAYNCEGFSDPENRQHTLSKAQRTDLALTFLQTIHQRGYTPMFYAAKIELEGQAQWETAKLQAKYKIWVAQYPAQPYPQTQHSSYSGTHHMWQFTPAGNVPGIPRQVDLNIAYFGYTNSQAPKDETPPDTVAPDPEALMAFSQVNETVTAKIETNLRSIPGQGSDSQVLYTLKNGETATRTGISDSGWSRIEFNGSTYYAVSSYLTTDLSYTPPQETQPQQEFQTKFTPVNEEVTAKEVVNLRDIPSMENSQVMAQLTHGEIAIRTGINHDVGWSRVEWNGQTLYCISSYLTAAQPAETEQTTGPVE